MKKTIIKFAFIATMLLLKVNNYAQTKEKSNSNTRNLIQSAEVLQISKDWNLTAEFESGLNELTTFFPIEIFNFKNNEKKFALQVDMKTLIAGSGMGIDKTNIWKRKTAWVDASEINEMINFIETYIIPNLKERTEKKQSISYLFNSKEIALEFSIIKKTRRISIFLKDDGIVDYDHYFWTESQVDKINDLLTTLKQMVKN